MPATALNRTTAAVRMTSMVPSVLDRRFEAVVFDWDGTAVPDREADAAERARSSSRSCARTASTSSSSRGTHVGNVDGAARARGRAGPGGLYLCVNRGSEVFAVGADGPRARRAARGDAGRGRRARRRGRGDGRAPRASAGSRREIVVAAAQPAQDRPDPRAGVGRSAEGADRRAARRGRGASARGRRPRPAPRPSTSPRGRGAEARAAATRGSRATRSTSRSGSPTRPTPRAGLFARALAGAASRPASC